MDDNKSLPIIDGVLQGVTTISKQFDFGSLVVIYLSLALFILVSLGFIYIAIKYRKGKLKPEEISNATHNTKIEVIWTVVPIFLVLIMFYYGNEGLFLVTDIPKDSMNIEVKAQKWSWNFKYKNGKKSNVMYAPVNTNVKLTLRAPVNDVIHSLFIPAFRIKQDIEPGKLTYTWFNATKEGVYPIECTEYCGAGHSLMINKVVVISKDKYNAWLNEKDDSESDPVALGEKIFKTDCASCHSINGSIIVGPSLNGIFGTKVDLVGKASVTIDDNYLIRAIKSPDDDIVKGFTPGIMSPFNNLKGKEINALVEYIKSLK